MTAAAVRPLLGAHMSVAGGLANAFGRIQAVGGQALQIFTRNQRQWAAKSIDDAEAAAFAAAWAEWGDYPVFSHAGYLINVATPKAEQAEKSVAALAAELERCHALSIPYLVLHPGSHGGAGVEAGIAVAAKRLDAALETAPGDTAILLENTAGQGTTLGADFTELAGIIAASAHPERFGICLDTCHAFAAGHDLAGNFDAVLAGLDAAVGLENVLLVHANDAKAPRGSHLDRHEHIGQGTLGVEPFRRLLNAPRLTHAAFVLETPKDEPEASDRRNLAALRSLLQD